MTICTDIDEYRDNPYYKKSSIMFSRIVKIFNDVEKVTNALAAIRHDEELKAWIFDSVSRLHETNAKLGTYVNWILTGRTDFPSCRVCGKTIIKDRMAVFGKYSSTCSLKCLANDPVYKESFARKLEAKYGPGINHISKIPGVSEKIQAKAAEKTQEEKDTILNKRRRSFIEHYGVDNNMKSKAGMAEYMAGMREKYGVDYTWEVPEIVEKAKQSTLERLGVDVSSKAESVKRKQAETNMRVYGHKCALQNPDVSKKTKKTICEVYGVDHYSQNAEVHKRQTYNWYEYNGLMFNSSWEIAFWIYHVDHNLKIEREPVKLEYVDAKGKKHVYFPDFRINGTLLVEIKGDDQFDSDGNMIDKLRPELNYIAKAKHKCMISNNVCILKSVDIQSYLDYVKCKYGKDYLKRFKRQKKTRERIIPL